MPTSQKFPVGSRIYYVDEDTNEKIYGTVVPYDHPYIVRYTNSNGAPKVWAMWEGKYSDPVNPAFCREHNVFLDHTNLPPTGQVYVYILNSTLQYSLEPVDGEIIAIVPYYEGFFLHDV